VSINLIKVIIALMVIDKNVCYSCAADAETIRLRLVFVITFTFFNWSGVFAGALVNVAVATSDAGSLGVSEPRIFVWAVLAGLHVSRVGDVARFVRKSAFVSAPAWLLSCCRLLATIPGIECVQLLVFLRVGDPLESLGGSNKPNVGPVMKNVIN